MVSALGEPCGIANKASTWEGEGWSMAPEFDRTALQTFWGLSFGLRAGNTTSDFRVIATVGTRQGNPWFPILFRDHSLQNSRITGFLSRRTGETLARTNLCVSKQIAGVQRVTGGHGSSARVGTGLGSAEVLIMQLHKVVLPSSFNLKGELMSL